MKTYRQFQPTGFDSRGLGLPDRQEWLVLPCARSRDSDCLTESNFHSALKSLGGEGDDVEVHRFGHWGPGWFEIILVRPGSPAEREANDIEAALSDYPVLDDSDFSDREHEAATEVWAHCYSTEGRIEYVRKHRSDMSFHGFADMLGCVRGKFFAGSPAELLS
jgi:hypothetical protein